MEHTSGIPLSLTSPKIWRGQNESNGQLMLIHNYHLAVGYSKLVISTALQAELTAAGKNGVPFGNGLWYDRNLLTTKPNTVYAGIPTASGAVPKFAGVLAYDAAISSLQPANAEGLLDYNKGKLIKRGFLRYKFGKNDAAGDAIGYDDITDDMLLFFEDDTGDPVFAEPDELDIILPTFTAAAVADVVTALSNKGGLTGTGKPTLADCTYAGKIIHRDVEDKAVIIELDF